MRAHSLATVGCDDTERNVGDIADAIAMRLVHRSRMEGGDLIVVHIGDDVRLRRVTARDHAHAFGRDQLAPEPVGVPGDIVPDGRHHDRLAAKSLEVVGDIAGAPSPVAPHFADLERDRQNMRLVRKNVPREPIGEDHDRVDRERAADEDAWRGHRVAKGREQVNGVNE